MPILARLLTAFAALLLLTSPGFAPIGARTVNRGVDATPALWVVKDADTSIYLFGTIHVLKPDVRWFHGPVRKAFDRSDTLVLEVLTPEPAEVARRTIGLALDRDGPPLTQKLPADMRARYLALLQSLDVPQAQLDPFQPWYAAVFLSMAPLERLGYRADAGVEDVLRNAAARHGKSVVALETIDDQLGFFAALPEPTQLRFLTATVEDAERAEEEIGKMLGNWAAGRPDILAAEMNESLQDMPDVAEMLLFQRNRRWADWIARRMAEPGTVFIAVGAGHLAGKGSLLDDLAALGLPAERVDRGR